MLVLTPTRKRSRDEDSEESECYRNRHRRMSCGSVQDFCCEAYVPNAGFSEIRLSSVFTSVWACVALFVYSYDFTPQAIEDLSSIQKHSRQLKEKQILPMAMSTDTALVHQAFVRRIEGTMMDFPILSDTTRLVSSHLGLVDPTKGCSRRAMLLIRNDRTLLFSRLLDESAPYPIGDLFARI
ncbi:hypothetical protein BX666DRAFT_1911423 [Dichotomocladium elegans]|nr:hypothetical protein BX666DRAFT_1911423 [Dichotomocladium elegans]